MSTQPEWSAPTVFGYRDQAGDEIEVWPTFGAAAPDHVSISVNDHGPVHLPMSEVKRLIARLSELVMTAKHAGPARIADTQADRCKCRHLFSDHGPNGCHAIMTITPVAPGEAGRVACRCGRSRCRDCSGADPCNRCGSCCECYCSEDSFARLIGMCDGCGGIGECYCREE